MPTTDNEFAVLDTLKICDTVLFLVSAAGGIDFGDEPIDTWGQKILLSAFAQVSFLNTFFIYFIFSKHFFK